MLAGIDGATFGADAADELHAEAHVGFVASETAHGFGPGQTQERLVEFDAAQGLEQVFGHAFEGLDDVLLSDERHLAVNLGELRLTVGTQVLVAETLDNLEVAVEAGHHEQLLQCLRTLWQGVELTRVHAAGNDEVAGTFGRRTDEHRRLHFEETEV